MQILTTLAEYEEAIKKPKVAIDFTATWCPPCKRIGPVFEKLSGQEEYAGIEFYKIDVDDNAEVAEKEGIDSMPTFKFYVNGEVFKSFSGASEEKLKTHLEELKSQ